MNSIPLFSGPWVERLGWTLVHFLWQGTAIAAVFGAWRYFYHASAPRTRYALACWTLAAMAAAPVATWFLLAPEVMPGAAPPAISHVIANAPLRIMEAAGPAVRAPRPLLSWVVFAWMAGTVAFWIRLTGGWIVARRLRRCGVCEPPTEWQQKLDRLAQRVRVSRPVHLLISAAVGTPAVIGWLRPVILVPAGALAGLPAGQMEALLLHELAHIGRADYMVGILQGIAEALLFYHPAVWWVSNQIRNERELCCDDVAVWATGDVLCYARALAAVEATRLTPMVAAANGGSLMDRVARLLGQPRPAARTIAVPVTVAGALLLASAGAVMFGQASPRPKFEVASVKPSQEEHFIGVRALPGGRLTASAPVRMLIVNAFGLPPYQVLGGPAWIDNDRFAIEAKAAGNADRPQMMPMLQSLLEERFQLQSHLETREMPVYALVTAKGGPKLPPPSACAEGSTDGTPVRPGTAPCGHVLILMGSGSIQLLGAAAPMSELVKMLSASLGRPVIDKTGVATKFDVHLQFTRDMAAAGLPPSAVPAPDPSGAAPPAELANPSIFTAVQEQLGLKLEGAKGPVEVLVIDHVEKPTGN